MSAQSTACASTQLISSIWIQPVIALFPIEKITIILNWFFTEVRFNGRRIVHYWILMYRKDDKFTSSRDLILDL